MHLRAIVDKAVAVLRAAAVGFALIALVVSGAFGAARFQQPRPTPDCETATTDVASLVATPGGEEPSDGMAPDGEPWTEPAACLHAAVVSAGGNGHDKHWCSVVYDGLRAHGGLHVPASAARAATVGKVSNLLAARFTLVGAKPSGTS